MSGQHSEASGFDSGVGRVADGGANYAAWAEISVQNAPGGVTASRESSTFSAGIAGTPDATIGNGFIDFAGTKFGVEFAQNNTSRTTDIPGRSADGSAFSGQRTDFGDGSARASVSDFRSVTDVDIAPDGKLRGVETLRNDSLPASRESGKDLQDKFTPNLGPDGKPDGTSSYTTPDGVRIDQDNCGVVTNVSKDGTSVYSRDGSQCVS
ncbi:MAG TPA: hypothetical protein V6C89_20810 [Drouetiella sp.]|jgi:hypothetical protein